MLKSCGLIGTIPFILLSALLFILNPIVTIAFIIIIFLFAFSFFNLKTGILLFAILPILLFNRYEIEHVSEYRHYVDIFPLYPLMLLIVYTAWIARRFTGIEDRTSKNYLNKAIVFFILWSAICLLWTTDIIHGVHLVFMMLINLFLVQLFTIYMEDNNDLKRILKFFLIVGLIIGIMTSISKFYILKYVYPIGSQQIRLTIKYGGEIKKDTFLKKGFHLLTRDLHEQETHGKGIRIRAGGFLDSESAAFVLNFTIFIVLSFLFGTNKKRKIILYSFLLLFMFIVTILTGTKGAFWGLIVGLFFALSMNPALRRRRISWSFIIILIFGFALLFNYFILKEGRIIGFALDKGAQKINIGSYTGRIEAWEKGFEKLFETSGIGVGTGTSAVVAQPFPHMHSFYLSVLFDLGIIGLTIYIGIVIRVFLELLKNIYSCDDSYLKNILCNLFAALVTASIHGLTFRDLNEYSSTLYWLIIGLIIAITTKYNSNKIGYSPN